jgi:hypothetical protein
MEAEERIREIAHRLWENSGRPEGQSDQHWAQARQIFDAQNPSFVKQSPPLAVSSSTQCSRERSMRSFDEILSDAQKALAASLQEAFDAGKSHTASELKRRMTALFEDLVSGDAEKHADTSSSPSSNGGHHTEQGHDHNHN